MTLLPFNPSAVPSPVRSAERAPRAERAERPVDPERPERTASSETTPPDFALLLALLGGAAPRPPRDIESRALTLESGEETALDDPSAATVEEFDDESPNADSSARTIASGTLADTDQRSLARTLRTDTVTDTRRAEALRAEGLRAEALRTAREVLATTAGDRSAALFGESMNRAGEGRTDDLAALAARAQRTGRAELLARGDQRAADVRVALDALLDVAGTPRGRAIAATVRPTTDPADVTTVVRDPHALAPEFRLRLDRVIDRMRDEFGHDVQLVETVRSSERQDHLFAQGRTRPGPVVTWTTDSAHLSGEAADVIVDGKWHNPQGYARLHAIAAEEGLRTLGMRDPGHLELRGAAGSREPHDHAPVAAATTAPAQHTGIAQVAQVARVAQVAQVARVARPGGGAVRPVDAPPVDNAAPSPTLNASATRLAGLASATGNGARQSDTNASDQSPRERRGDLARAAERAAPSESSAIGALSSTVERVLDGNAPRVVMPVGSTAAARAEAIAVLRDDAPARPISSLTMQLDAPDGATEEIRVSMRGGVVGTQISTSNAALADRLRMQTADLQDALGRHGLDTESLRVQQTARPQDGDAVRQALTDRSDVLRAAGANAGQQAGHEPGTRDRPTTRQHPEPHARDDRDAPAGDHPQRRQQSRQENL